MTRKIDVALCLLVMGGEETGGYLYFGTVTSNSENEYNSINWIDERKKPTWQELNEYWDNNQSLFDKFYV